MTISSKGMRTGRLSNEEKLYIEENATKLTAQQIANKLGRELESVQRQLIKIGKSVDTKQNVAMGAEYDLRTTPHWKELQSQFNEEELESFLYNYKQIYSQLRDVTPTENLMILDLCRITVLCDRNLREQQRMVLQIGSLDKEIERLKREGSKDKETIMGFERQITIYLTAKETIAREYKELFSRKSNLSRDLKITRDQRLNKVLENTTTYWGLLDKLLRDSEFSEKCSLELSRMNEAIKNERERLGGDYHKFNDGNWDLVLLNHETILNMKD